MHILSPSDKILVIIGIACDIFLIGYAAVHWPSLESYLYLGIGIVCPLVVGILWVRRVQYLKSIEADCRLARIQEKLFNYTDNDLYELMCKQGDKRFGRICKHEHTKNGKCLDCLRKVITPKEG